MKDTGYTKFLQLRSKKLKETKLATFLWVGKLKVLRSFGSVIGITWNSPNLVTLECTELDKTDSC